MFSYLKRLGGIALQAIRPTRPVSNGSMVKPVEMRLPDQRFCDPTDDWSENLERYQPGGFCPISLSSYLNNEGQYKVVHKLGGGGSATVWAAVPVKTGGLVAIKILQAEKGEVAERELALAERLRSTEQDTRALRHIRVPLSTFKETSPNGVHTCLVQSLTGPTLDRILRYGSLREGSTRIRADLVPRFAWQAASAIKLLHGMNIALHDITPANWAIQVKEEVYGWSQAQLYYVSRAES